MKLKDSVGYILFYAVMYSLDKSIQQKSVTGTKRQENKLTNLQKDKRWIVGKEAKLVGHNVHNFSLYQLSSG